MDELENDFDGGGSGEAVEPADDNGAENNSDVSPALENEGAQNEPDVPPASENGDKPTRDRTDIPDQRWDELIAERNRLRDEAAANQPYIEALKGLGDADTVKQRFSTFAETERQKQQTEEDRVLGETIAKSPLVARLLDEGHMTEEVINAVLIPAFKQLNRLEPLGVEAEQARMAREYETAIAPFVKPVGDAPAKYPHASDTEMRLAYANGLNVEEAARSSHLRVQGLIDAAVSKNTVDLQNKKSAPTVNAGSGGTAPVNNDDEAPDIHASDAEWDAWHRRQAAKYRNRR